MVETSFFAFEHLPSAINLVILSDLLTFHNLYTSDSMLCFQGNIFYFPLFLQNLQSPINLRVVLLHDFQQSEYFVDFYGVTIGSPLTCIV